MALREMALFGGAVVNVQLFKKIVQEVDNQILKGVQVLDTFINANP